MSEMKESPRFRVFHGTIVKRGEEITTVALYPGLTLDLRTKDIEEIEEAKDEATQRTYVRVVLKEDADVTANYKPRLARLAAEAQGVPFAYGGPSCDAPHMLASGSAAPMYPPIDPRGRAAFPGRVPPEPFGDVFAGGRRWRMWPTECTREFPVYTIVIHNEAGGPVGTRYKIDEYNIGYVIDDESNYGF